MRLVDQPHSFQESTASSACTDSRPATKNSSFSAGLAAAGLVAVIAAG